VEVFETFIHSEAGRGGGPGEHVVTNVTVTNFLNVFITCHLEEVSMYYYYSARRTCMGLAHPELEVTAL